MAIVLPLVVNQQLVGSAVLVAVEGNTPLFATALHLVPGDAEVQIAIPPHAGVVLRIQFYPTACRQNRSRT